MTLHYKNEKSCNPAATKIVRWEDIGKHWHQQKKRTSTKKQQWQMTAYSMQIRLDSNHQRETATT
jgi:hypothetical protein